MFAPFAARVMPRMSMCRAHSPAPVWILVQAITSPCALQKVECEHCSSLGSMTPEGLRLMRNSCPPRPLGPSLPTQALLGCPEQQAHALLPVVFLLWGTEKPFLLVLKGYRAGIIKYHHETAKFPPRNIS